MSLRGSTNIDTFPSAVSSQGTVQPNVPASTRASAYSNQQQPGTQQAQQQGSFAQLPQQQGSFTQQAQLPQQQGSFAQQAYQQQQQQPGQNAQQPGAGYFQQPQADVSQGIRAAPGVLQRAAIMPSTEPPPPPDNFCFAVFTALFCFCSPLGCMALKSSRECKSSLAGGQLKLAEKKARVTKTLASAALAVGIGIMMLAFLIAAIIMALKG